MTTRPRCRCARCGRELAGKVLQPARRTSRGVVVPALVVPVRHRHPDTGEWCEPAPRGVPAAVA